MEYKARYNSWLNDPSILAEYREELRTLTDEKEIEDRFYRDLEFGTAGLRGVRGAGTNRMNEHTVGKAAEGLGRYLKKTVGVAKIVIAYDSRIKSPEFAQYTAEILAHHGHIVYLYDALRPVPLLSFAVRYLKADSGVVITASHNPAEYNGFKVYGSYGGQVTDEDADAILNEILSIATYAEIVPMDFEAPNRPATIIMIGDDVDRHYYDSIKTLTIQRSHQRPCRQIEGPLYPPPWFGQHPGQDRIEGTGVFPGDCRSRTGTAGRLIPTAPYPNRRTPRSSRSH